MTTAEGSSTTVQPRTSTDGAVAELFEGSASCSVTSEQTEGFYFEVDAIRTTSATIGRGARSDSHSGSSPAAALG